MATINCTNIKASQAIRGEASIVTVSGAESISVFPLLEEGQSCVIESSNKTAYIYSIDRLGTSFKISPVTMDDMADSDTPGILKVDELIVVTISDEEGSPPE
jgi:hypothetical protein